jgi:hypothetical protein
MTVCERCWTKAILRAASVGGFVADHYRDLLAEHPNGHNTAEPSGSTTINERKTR